MEIRKVLLKRYKCWILVFSLILILLIVGGIFFIINDNKNFKMTMEVIKEDNNNYNIEINYPVFNNRKVNKKIKKIINTEKNNFKEQIKKEDKIKNELNIDYGYSVKNDIYSIHLRTYSYIGKDNKYYRDDEMIYINAKNNKEVELKDLVNAKIYEVIKDDCYKYLNNKKINLYEDSVIKEALNNLKDFALLSFSEDEMFVIIPPYKVSDSEIDLNININYNKVKDYLNKDYFTLINTVKETVNSTVIKERNLEDFKDKKLLAITFDDGPNYKITENLLDELDKRNVKVTFFMVGNRINSQTALVKEAYDRGHTIGSHSYDHKRLTKLSSDKLKEEIDTTNEIIKNITGEDVKFLRPPYGSYNKDLLNSIDMSFILWNVDTEDWKSKDKDKVCEHIITHASDGNIILLHDLYQTSVDGALCAIDKLKTEGYEFVTIEEMAEIKGIELKTHTAYRYIKKTT